MNTQTLRERFEKRYPLPDDFKWCVFKKKYRVRSNAYPKHYQDANKYTARWEAYQSGAEDNQANKQSMLELQNKQLMGAIQKYGMGHIFSCDLRRFPNCHYEESVCTCGFDACKAAIEASGARIK